MESDFSPAAKTERAVYAIAQLSIHDRAGYDTYASQFVAVLHRHRGELLAADEAPQVLEGAWSHEKVVLLRFASESAFFAFANSESYQSLSRARKAASKATVLLVHGVPQPADIRSEDTQPMLRVGEGWER